MSWKKWVVLLGVALILVPTSFAAREGGFPYKLMNRLRVEYDDNYDEVKDNPRSSFKVIEELELAVDINMQQTFIGFNVRPNFIWWENRPDDSTDFHVYFDAILNHNFSRRVKLSIKETFRRAEAPELIENGESYRKESNFNFNTVDGALSVLVRPKMYMDVSAGYSLIRYDNSELADENDYNKYKAGLRARYQLVPETELSASFDYENIDYPDSPATRKSQSYLPAVGVEHMFSPNLMGSARAGWQLRDNQDAFTDNSSSPYGNIGLTILPSPATRISLGGDYMLTETDIFPFTDQQRLRGYASVSYDLTAKLTLNVGGSYTHGEYNADTLPRDATVGELPAAQQAEIDQAAGTTVNRNAPLTEAYIDSIKDASEKVYRLSTSMQYKINRINWVEVGWRYTTMDSELREDFNRNVFHAGWKLKL
jgi:hypothetical protein